MFVISFFFECFYRPHKCPDPKPRITTANNFVMRSARRQMGCNCKSMDRKLIHSRFCPVQTIRLPSDDGFFTCARFMVILYLGKNVFKSVFTPLLLLYITTGYVKRFFFSSNSLEIKQLLWAIIQVK